MAMQTQTPTGSGQDQTAEEKIRQLRELFADCLLYTSPSPRDS